VARRRMVKCCAEIAAPSPSRRLPRNGAAIAARPAWFPRAALGALAIAHVDCGAFYAAVEKPNGPISPIVK
jgi:hypothetical protein